MNDSDNLLDGCSTNIKKFRNLAKVITFTDVRIAGSSFLIVHSTLRQSFPTFNTIRENAQNAHDKKREQINYLSHYRDLLRIYPITRSDNHLIIPIDVQERRLKNRCSMKNSPGQT